jgi:aryl sulfotransferase
MASAATQSTTLVRAKRAMRNHSVDSTRWDQFRFRNGDIVIATWPKSGTTWLQQIVGQLVFDGAEDVPIFSLAPWVEYRKEPIGTITGLLEAQAHRRFVKTHLPADALSLSSLAKYVFVGRDGRDAVWSWHNHHRRLTQRSLDELNDIPGRVGPPLGPAANDVRRCFHDWLDGDGFPLWPFWSQVQSWWDIRHHENVMLVHFERLKLNLLDEIRRIAAFLEIDVGASSWQRIVEHCTFDYMSAHATHLLPETTFRGDARRFLNEGTNGRWRDALSRNDVRKYERVAAESLSSDCAHWLATGEASRDRLSPPWPGRD